MPDAVPCPTEPLEVFEADDGLVIHDPRHHRVHTLNHSAAILFYLCDGTRDVEAIATMLSRLYRLPVPARDQATAGLQQLADLNLIHWDAHAAEFGSTG